MASRSAREVAYETIRSRIITMELKPGDELNDRELAHELGISRTPMREALIMLNIAHMVVIKPQSGTHVAPIDLKLMEMEQFARFTLEKVLQPGEQQGDRKEAVGKPHGAWRAGVYKGRNGVSPGHPRQRGRKLL